MQINSKDSITTSQTTHCISIINNQRRILLWGIITICFGNLTKLTNGCGQMLSCYG